MGSAAGYIYSKLVWWTLNLKYFQNRYHMHIYSLLWKRIRFPIWTFIKKIENASCQLIRILNLNSKNSKYSKYIGTYTFFSRSDISFCKTPRTIRSANQISFQEALHVIGMFANPVNNTSHTSSFRFFKVSIHPIANHLQSVCVPRALLAAAKVY